MFEWVGDLVSNTNPKVNAGHPCKTLAELNAPYHVQLQVAKMNKRQLETCYFKCYFNFRIASADKRQRAQQPALKAFPAKDM